MILSVHMLVGAAIGSKITNLWSVSALALISHLLLDILPHWEYKSPKPSAKLKNWLKVILDLFIGSSMVGFVIWFLPDNKIPILVGTFAALIPDGIEVISWYWPNKYLKLFSRFHSYLHKIASKNSNGRGYRDSQNSAQNPS